MTLADLYRRQRDLGKSIAELNRERPDGWATQIEEERERLNEVIAFCDSVTTALGSFPREIPQRTR